MTTNTNVMVHMFVLELCVVDKIRKIFEISCIVNKCLITKLRTVHGKYIYVAEHHFRTVLGTVLKSS